MVHELIQIYQKFKCLKQDNQENFLEMLLGPLLKSGLPLIRNVFKTLAKSVLVPLGLTAAVSVVDAAIQKKSIRTGITISIISNKEMDVVMKLVKSLKDTGLLTKGVSKTSKKWSKRTKRLTSWYVFRYIGW